MNRYNKQPANAGSPGSSTSRPSNSAREAALTGAAKAFINGLPPQELARYVNGHSPQPPPKPLPSRSRAGSTESFRSNPSRQDVALNRLPFAGDGSLSVQQSRVPNGSRPQSNMSAALAAARASNSAPYAHSVSPLDTRTTRTRPPARLPESRTGSSVASVSAERLDETPIPPTTSLVQMFEQNKSPEDKRKTPPLIASKPPSIQSPKPVRNSRILDTGLTPLFPPNSEQLVHDRLAANGLSIHAETRHAGEDSDGSVDSFASAKEAMSPIKPSKPPLPLARRKARQDNGSVARGDPVKPGIQVHPRRRDPSTTAPIDIRRPPSSRATSSHRSPNSHPSIMAAYHQMHPRRMTPLTTGDSLANAIVASSLASSRAPSPHKLPPLPVGRQKQGSVSHSLFSRTPSPPKKGMRHTMRRWSSASSESDDVPFAKHKKKKFLRKHPNKHHEGDRKRWRDAITERERKRYEGVWAANKGVHSFFTMKEQDYLDEIPHGRHAEALRDSVAEQVTDIVTHDIWSRSRLPEDVLEQVWDLVDTQVNGRLLKEEFVVGLWLVDQCLKGRKLPVKVTESVWNSVRFLHGIKVRKR